MIKYKNYQLIRPDEKQAEMIKHLIEDFCGSVFHEHQLNLIVEKKFGSEFFYLVDDPLNIKNASPIHITTNNNGLKRYHFKPLFDIPYAGIIGSDNIQEEEIRVGLFESFKYLGFPFQKENIGGTHDANLGKTAMVDLDQEEDEIFNKVIHSKRRNMIRKAVKNGVIIKEYYSSEGLKLFWPILEELHKRFGANHLSFDYYDSIMKNYGSSKQSIILIAFKNERPVSGIFILGNKNYMHYYKGASVFGVKNEGQGELLQWEAIKLSKSLGIRYYDLCNLDKLNLPDIYRFKTGMSNIIYSYPKISKNGLGYKLMNKL